MKDADNAGLSRGYPHLLLYAFDKMKEYLCILSIAGSDCSGGAGIQADLKTISALGGYAATAITAVTVQDTTGVHAIHAIPPSIVYGQIEAVMEDIRPSAIKIGMINNAETAHTVATCLRKYKPYHVVLDPVMLSSSKHQLIADDAIDVLVRELIPQADLVTPNLQEAEVLAGHPIDGLKGMKAVTRELVALGCRAVLVKGGHLEGEMMYDVLHIAGEADSYLFTSEKIKSINTHGTGCSLSSAIATFLASGYALPQAVKYAKRYVTDGIAAGKEVHIGKGHGPLNHFHTPIPLCIKETK